MTRILVVEDEAAIRNGLCDVLAFHGYVPEGVERGDEGLRVRESGALQGASLSQSTGVRT